MKKKDIIEMLKADYELTPTKAKGIYNSFIDLMSISLAKDGVVDLAEFGKFTVRKVKARQARNPWSGEIIHIPERKRIFFKAKKALLEIINK
jgi:nucleoid DNA-binding protein